MRFKDIQYHEMLLQTLGAYLSVNSSGKLSILYKNIYACLKPLQSWFNDFSTWRNTERIIADCRWEIGQLTNVLNYLFDTTLKRIFISQRQYALIFSPTLDYESLDFDPSMTTESAIYEPNINDIYTVNSQVVVNLPSDLYNDNYKQSEIISVVEQIKIDGIHYVIEEI
jgi:hypothetical protein